MGWLILNLFLILLIMAIYQLLNPDRKESFLVELLFGFYIVGSAILSILGLQQTEAVEELLKRMSIIEVVVVFLGSVAIALRKKESRG